MRSPVQASLVPSVLQTEIKMSTITAYGSISDFRNGVTTSANADTFKPTRVERFFARIVVARQLQAERAVASHLAHWSDADLRHYGHSTEDIARLRALQVGQRTI